MRKYDERCMSMSLTPGASCDPEQCVPFSSRFCSVHMMYNTRKRSHSLHRPIQCTGLSIVYYETGSREYPKGLARACTHVFGAMRFNVPVAYFSMPTFSMPHGMLQPENIVLCAALCDTT